jgi:hypothetical protein
MPKTNHLFDPSGYATVAERIELFYQNHPTGRILTELVSRNPDERTVTFRAMVYRESSDTEPAAIGWAEEREGDGDINTVACVENTETSAIGRALANLGFTASRRRPSVEEMEKASRARARHVRAVAREGTPPRDVATPMSPVQDHDAGSVVTDLVDLLECAERAGLPDADAQRVRDAVSSEPPLTLDDIAQLERRLRAWLARARAGEHS